MGGDTPLTPLTPPSSHRYATTTTCENSPLRYRNGKIVKGGRGGKNDEQRGVCPPPIEFSKIVEAFSKLIKW
ncbi:MAG: hypothetical protein ACFFC7_21640 [Candidatus Hermodarchaeota archaeon]